ncbi:MAG: histidine phosphatase family protein [Anaerolineaceae bacterium]|nr:histidine phosphatase family protein [Anaerolineaceae bacterium]MBN2676698.1 histidine phosphatase family protein [Anaerolineaceae bacterium]
MTTTILLVRHGQTDWNKKERFRGRADIPLNDNGMQQAEATGCHIAAGWQPVAIYSSPLSRAVSTAEAIAHPTGINVEICQGLIDIDYGEWQGLAPDEVRERWPENLDLWYAQPQLAEIPGGETLQYLRSRAMKTVNELARRHDGHTIVLVGHTVINRIILLGVLGLDDGRFWHLRQEPCAINVFEYVNGEYTLVTLNDTRHLSDITQV